MIRKSGYRFSEKIMLQQKLERDDDSKKSHPAPGNQSVDASSHIPIDESSLRYDGWRIVAICFLVATFGWAFGFYGQSVYLAELHREHGWPASLISGATTFFYLFGALIVVFVSEAVKKFGPRSCLIA